MTDLAAEERDYWREALENPSPDMVYASATGELVEARLAVAEAFLRIKLRHKGITDGQAERMAYVETKGATDLAEARQYIAKHFLDRR
jgi:hypothetical protein